MPLTSELVPDKLAAFDLAHTAEQGPDLLLAHILGQVVDDQIRLRDVVLRVRRG